MEDKTVATSTTAVTSESPVGYRKSGDGLETFQSVGSHEGSGAHGTAVHGVMRHLGDEEVVDEAVLEQGIHAIEGRQKKWYTYLTTRDFWVVLVIGYVFSQKKSCAIL